MSITLALILTAALTLLLVLRLNLSMLVSYLLAINTTTLLAYTYDKRVAGGDRQRVPERVLHGLALLGGTPAAFAGQFFLRHKTRKGAFRGWFFAIVGVQLAALVAWAWTRFR